MTERVATLYSIGFTMRPFNKSFSALASAGLLVIVSGCQTGLNGLPIGQGLNNSSRIAPPGTGSYRVNVPYGQGVGTGVSSAAKSNNATPGLAKLRSMETGSPSSEIFGSEGRISSTDMSETTLAARPAIAPAISASQTTLLRNSQQASDAANVSFSQSGQPPVISASAIQTRTDLPNVGISDGVTWKTTR